MENKVFKTMISALALSGAALAGPGTSMPTPAFGAGYCHAMDVLGDSVYEGGFINSVKFAGRAHLNGAFTDGEVGGADFDDSYVELRRFRFGTKVQFLNDFTLVAAADMNDESSRDDVRFGYKQMDELYLKYSAGNIMGLEKVSLAYGRMKHNFTAEGTESSNRIKTVERSVISNHFYGGIRATGAMVSANSGIFKGKLGIFSSEADSTELSDWNHGSAIYASLGFDCSCGGTVTVQGLYNDVSAGDDDRFGYDWATSVSYTNKFGNWHLLVDGIYGEETNGDSTYGLVVRPSTYVIPDTLEVVARYEYANSDGNNISTSRYTSQDTRNSIDGRGILEERHAIYAGLNYYLCGNNAKVMLGAEYETGENDAGVETDASTLWLAFRTTF